MSISEKLRQEIMRYGQTTDSNDEQCVSNYSVPSFLYIPSRKKTVGVQTSGDDAKIQIKSTSTADLINGRLPLKNFLNPSKNRPAATVLPSSEVQALITFSFLHSHDGIIPLSAHIADFRVTANHERSKTFKPHIRYSTKAVGTDVDRIIGEQLTDFMDTETDDISAVSYAGKKSKAVCAKWDESFKCFGTIESSCLKDCQSYSTIRRFTLGTADVRCSNYDRCGTMLIGGCRVPVCRNLKTRF